MTNEPMSFEEFTDALRAAGWQSVNDAQHENVRYVYDEWIQRLRNTEVAAEYWRLQAENRSE